MTTKEQFLIAHNKLSPVSLKVSIDILTRFKVEKPALFKSEDWPIDRLRRPFVFWLTSLAKEKK